ncbi:PDZ domain-containing protein [Streptomyces sp. NPDC001941]|uniref:S41 family peptidase n=1 Tax=Streptomyces sp. NPDC001941 TaxID=3154659 RepID=UPI00332E5F30
MDTARPAPYLFQPHLAHDLLAFVADDDVWLAPLGEAATDGAVARRATAGDAPAAHPRLSPDARQLAWTAGHEVHTAAVDGGTARRLTHWADAECAVRGWLSPTEVLALRSAPGQGPWRTWAWAVPLDGPARRLPYGPVRDVQRTADGELLLGTPVFRDPASWKRYGGGMGGTIWRSSGATYERVLAEVGDHLVDPLPVGDRIAFLSDHEGTGALYSAAPDGSGPRRHTPLGGHYARHATTDGTRVVYQSGGDLWLLPALDAEPVRLRLTLGGQLAGRQPFTVTAAEAPGDVALDADGRTVTLEVRGTVQQLTANGAARTLLDTPGVRRRLPVAVPGGDAVLCVSDAEGEDGLELTAPGPHAPRRFATGKLGRVTSLAVSPDGAACAVASDDGRLLVVALETGEVTEIARATHREVRGPVFSPDSGHLAWSQFHRPTDGSTPAQGSHIRLARLSDGLVTDVTAPRFDDTDPVFTRDGRYLAFLSSRTFDPVYDQHAFDLGFLPGVRPYLAVLAVGTPSPFGPSAGTGTGAGIDLDGLADRVVAVPVAPALRTALTAVADGLAWLAHPLTGNLGTAPRAETTLEHYDLTTRQHAVLATGAEEYAVSGDGTRLAVRTPGGLSTRPATPTGSLTPLPLDQVRVTVDPVAERRQMLAETWRLARDGFWRADLGGTDWTRQRERYAALAERVSTYGELADVLWELHGELGASHAYVKPPAPRFPAGPGLLGADLSPDGEGHWRVDRVVPGETSAPGARSPLAEPGVDARAGDRVTAVDGQPVDPVHGPAAALSGRAGEPVVLTLDRDGRPHDVTVVPLPSEAELRHHDLVRTRRTRVAERSGGRLGYLHLPDMMSTGWAALHRDLNAELAHDGLLLDLRGNTGGHVSPLLLEILGRRTIGWDVSRGSGPAAYPPGAPRGPVVVLADERTGSDAEMAVHALRLHGTARIVGTRTWGGALGMDDPAVLVDGTRVTQPRHAFWFEGVGWGLENRGVDPDTEVTIAPHDWAEDHDPQLEAAVREALAALERTRPATPPERPDRTA